MSECMQFPDTWEEFEQAYGFEDKEEIYTNGSRLIQSFRVKQWLDHIAEPEHEEFEWCHDCKEYDQEKHCCHRWTKVIRNTVEEMQMMGKIAKVIEHDASINTNDGYKYYRTEYICGNCKKKVIGGDEYCSHCGARLEWEL